MSSLRYTPHPSQSNTYFLNAHNKPNLDINTNFQKLQEILVLTTKAVNAEYTQQTYKIN